MLPADVLTKDVIFARRKSGNRIEVFLTNRKRELRAAAVYDGNEVRTVAIQKAATQFKRELSLFAGEAATDLPPVPKRNNEKAR
jgi:hypothetical protein